MFVPGIRSVEQIINDMMPRVGNRFVNNEKRIRYRVVKNTMTNNTECVQAKHIIVVLRNSMNGYSEIMKIKHGKLHNKMNIFNEG